MIYHQVAPYRVKNIVEKQRLERARATWPVVRNELWEGEKVKTIIENGTRELDPWEVIVFTNADTCWCVDTLRFVESYFENGYNAIYSRRRNFDGPIRRQLRIKDLEKRGERFEGVDLVAFTKGWWDEHRAEIPDLWIGYQGWDWVFKFMIGEAGELEREIIYHEKHQPKWMGDRSRGRNLENRIMCYDWINRQADAARILAAWNDQDEWRDVIASKEQQSQGKDPEMSL